MHYNSLVIYWCTSSRTHYTVVNGSRIEFPLYLGLQLKQYLKNRIATNDHSINEWINALNEDDRFEVRIKSL